MAEVLAVIADTWLLVSLRWQMLWNGLRARSLLSKLWLGFGLLWLVLGVGGFSAALGYGAGRLLTRSPPGTLRRCFPARILTTHHPVAALQQLRHRTGVALS